MRRRENPPLPQISGPDQEHFSVFDVPGIFEITTEGLTIKADIKLVEKMVKDYMENYRSVILAVIPAKVDVATQEILELAALLDSHTRRMKLGWPLIRNPGQKELQVRGVDHYDLEAEFFHSCEPWSSIEKDKVGADALRLGLNEVLSSLVKGELSKVKIDIKGRLEACRERLSHLGAERNSPSEQTAYLTQLATDFQRLVFLALHANHGADESFKWHPRLRDSFRRSFPRWSPSLMR